MARFYCWGCGEFRDFDELFNDYDKHGYCTKCNCNIKGESVGTRPVDCAPTCDNVLECEHSCIGYKVREN